MIPGKSASVAGLEDIDRCRLLPADRVVPACLLGMVRPVVVLLIIFGHRSNAEQGESRGRESAWPARSIVTGPNQGAVPVALTPVLRSFFAPVRRLRAWSTVSRLRRRCHAVAALHHRETQATVILVPDAIGHGSARSH